MGAQMVKEVASKTNDIAGDGTTTATVLAQAIITAGLKNVAAGANPMDVKRGIDKAVSTVVAELKKLSTEVGSDNDKIKQVATISANGDEYIGGLIANAMSEVGTSGLVTVEKSKTTNTELKLVRGVKIDRGYVSPYFINDTEKSKTTLEDPLVLILSCKLNSLTQILPILEKVHQTGKSLFIIACFKSGFE